jgi:hypothetical protein
VLTNGAADALGRRTRVWSLHRGIENDGRNRATGRVLPSGVGTDLAGGVDAGIGFSLVVEPHAT